MRALTKFKNPYNGKTIFCQVIFLYFQANTSVWSGYGVSHAIFIMA